MQSNNDILNQWYDIYLEEILFWERIFDWFNTNNVPDSWEKICLIKQSVLEWSEQRFY